MLHADAPFTMFDVQPVVFCGLALFAAPSLVVASRPGVSRSRRALACALVVLVPIAGLLLAMIVRRARGGTVALEPVQEPAPGRLSISDVGRLGEMPPVLDRLLTGDSAERLEALVALSSSGDASAVAVLRWALEHGPSDVVLDAALTLEEIELRGEARMVALRELLGTTKNAELALAVAEASACLVLNRIADPAVAPSLAAEARAHYEQALAWAPERSFEIEEKLAQLEIAAGQPRDALAVLDRMLSRELATPGQQSEDDLGRISRLRDHAAFAAREFDVLSFNPATLVEMDDLSARRALRASRRSAEMTAVAPAQRVQNA